jgi:hypothetical protein
MRVRGTHYQEVIDHLPEGATLVLQDVAWKDYEQLLDDVGSRRPGLRMTYDQGRLEVMSPLRKHEKYKDFITLLMHALAEELGIPLESSGSTTWKNNLSGFEPNTCNSKHFRHDGPQQRSLKIVPNAPRRTFPLLSRGMTTGSSATSSNRNRDIAKSNPESRRGPETPGGTATSAIRSPHVLQRQSDRVPFGR